MTLKPGDRIVARGLPVRPDGKGEKMPPKIALVCRVDDEGILISLRVVGASGTRFHRRPRACRLDQVARLATPREVAVGVVIEPLPPV